MKEDTDKTWMEVHGGFARDKTLRDEFAMRAMQADLTGYDGSYWARVAKHAYEMADAMLEARKAK
jgi:hypothetical protein